MIKKLKKLFIILATISMFFLMSILVLIMNIVNYNSVISESDQILDFISRDAFMFIKNDEMNEDNKPPVDDTNPQEKDNDLVDDTNFQNKDDNLIDEIKNHLPNGMSPEVPYESRYFSVRVSNDGEITETELDRIISIDKDTAVEYVNAVLSKSGDKGLIGNFRYIKTTEDGITKITFLDIGRRLDAFKSFMWTSILVGLFGCIVVFIAFIFVAGRITRPIAESYEKQKRFITDAGHEIKTPLTIISANADILESDIGENENLDDIREQTVRLTKLTNDLVYLSKMEESGKAFPKIDFPISDIVTESALSFQNLASSQDKDILLDIEPNISMNGSPDMIKQLVSIMVENAIKYSTENSTIKVEMNEQKKAVHLSVFNTTYEEINKETLPYLFERFYRSDASRNSETGGHGIGLSIAKAIVESLNGKISASTETGYDFKISITIPNNIK